MVVVYSVNGDDGTWLVPIPILVISFWLLVLSTICLTTVACRCSRLSYIQYKMLHSPQHKQDMTYIRIKTKHDYHTWPLHYIKYCLSIWNDVICPYRMNERVKTKSGRKLCMHSFTKVVHYPCSQLTWFWIRKQWYILPFVWEHNWKHCN